MGHNHHHHENGSSVNIRSAFFLNLVFTIIEIIGGFITNSIAILSDALHDLGDSISLGLSWYFQNISQKERDAKFSFGYKRFSIFGALINSIILVTGSFFIVYEAIPRIISPTTPNAHGMFILAILGIVFNGIAVLKTKKGSSLNEKVVMLHLLEDVLGWAAVLIASIVMIFYDLPILDPVLSLAIAAYILYNAFKNMTAALKIFLQAIPQSVNIKEIEQKVSSLSGIHSVHDTHLWSMDGEYNVLTIHIVIDTNADLQTISTLKKNVRKELKSEGINHITMEFEGVDEECLQFDCE